MSDPNAPMRWDGEHWRAHEVQGEVVGGAVSPQQQPYPPHAQQPHGSPYPQQPYSPYAQPQPYPPYAQPFGTPMAVTPKNPGLSLLVSFFIPGVGSMMNGDAGIGAVILVGWLLSWPLWAFCFIGAPFTLAFFVWGLVDAYQGAQRWNRQHGIIS